MKKITAILLTALLVVFLCSCDKKDDTKAEEQTTTTVVTTTKRYFPDSKPDQAYSTTKPSSVVGKEETSEKYETGENEYYIAYYTADGSGKKYEFYKDNKIRYSCVDVAVDKDGNVLRQEYYDADGKLLVVFDNGYYYDGQGNQITDNTADNLLGLVS